MRNRSGRPPKSLFAAYRSMCRAHNVFSKHSRETTGRHVAVRRQNDLHCFMLEMQFTVNSHRIEYHALWPRASAHRPNIHDCYFRRVQEVQALIDTRPINHLVHGTCLLPPWWPPQRNKDDTSDSTVGSSRSLRRAWNCPRITVDGM